MNPNPDVMTDPAPSAYFLKFGDTSLHMELQVFIANPSSSLKVRHELLTAIDRAFREANIVIRPSN